MAKTVLVVGGGAAGLMAALSAAQAGAKVEILEQIDRPGARLSAAGGGRGNVTILLSPEEIAAAFGRHGRFTMPALAVMDPQKLCDFFHQIGLPTTSPDGLHVYPASNRAADVTSALIRHSQGLGVILHYGVKVDVLMIRDVKAESGIGKKVVGVSAGGKEFAADAVIIAAGGRSYSSLGGGESGYALASQVGHKVVEPVPALVPLITGEKWAGKLAGLSVADVRIRIDLPRWRGDFSQGDLLFTHRGISGPAVLNISGKIARLLAASKKEPIPILVEWTIAATAKMEAKKLERWRSGNGAAQVRDLLAKLLPRRLALELANLAGLPEDCICSRMPRAAQDELAALLAATPLSITATEGFEKAMVTSGGVALKEVDPKTLGSRLAEGLFFAGEVLDLDGPTGGFNLEWAFASGHLAGAAAADQGKD